VLLTAVALRVAELVTVNDLQHTQETETNRLPLIAAEIFYSEGGRVVRLEGTPGTRVVMLDDEQPIDVLTLGDEGVLEVRIPDTVGPSERVRLMSLSESTVDLDLSGMPPPSPTPPPSTTAAPRPKVTAPTATIRPVVAAGPTPVLSPPVLQLVTDAGPRIALTFDGNSSSNGTGDLLNVLHDLDLEVTLFVTGQFINKYPGIIRRAVLSGHEVGNHTYSHPHLTTYEQNRRHTLRTGMTKVRFQNELRRTEMAFRKATGRAMMPLWRAPYGEENRALRGWALEMGYLHIRWSSLEGASLDSRDWVADEHSSLYQNSSTMMDRLLRFPELRGGIVLMHLATDRDEPPWEALPAFVESLRERGVTPTTIIGLLESSEKWRPWLQRAQTRHRETFEP
jgi:peptidoglycan/xylan/chitin deacetylase (PgdA/CDA1 family)